MTIKEDQVVFVNDSQWYILNKDEKGHILNNNRDNIFVPDMEQYCGKSYTVLGIYNTALVLKDTDTGKVIPYVFYEEWLSQDGNHKTPKADENPDIATIIVKLADAKRWFDSENSELQELAMRCFPIKRLVE